MAPRRKMKRMLQQTFGVTNEEYYGTYGIFCSGQLAKVIMISA